MFVAVNHDFVPMPGLSLSSWFLYTLWVWYTLLFGIGLPLYKGVTGVGDALLKIRVTDLGGRGISRLKLAGRQVACCLLLFWMLLPSPLYAGVVVNVILFSLVFRKDKRHDAYMHAVDHLFQTTVINVKLFPPEKRIESGSSL